MFLPPFIKHIFDYHPENSQSRGVVINCCGGDQCLWNGDRKKFHCSCSAFLLFNADSPATQMTNGGHSGMAIWYLASWWTGNSGPYI